MKKQLEGLLFGFLGVLGFSFTLLATRMALGGVPRISQLQLLQPFMTLGLAALFLNEPLSPASIICAALVAFSIILGQKGLPK